MFLEIEETLDNTNKSYDYIVIGGGAIGAATTLGVGLTNASAATGSVTGQTLNVTAFSYDQVTGVGVVGSLCKVGVVGFGISV